MSEDGYRIRGRVKVIKDKKLVVRYGVITANKELEIFADDELGDTLVSLPISTTTKINMVQNRQFCFQVVGAKETIVMELSNEFDMSQWINQILCCQVLRMQVKEIFSILKNEQTPELMHELKGEFMYDDEKFIREKMLQGEIPMCGWTQKWLGLREEGNQLPSLIAEQTRVLEKQQARLSKVQAQVAESQEKLDQLVEKESTRDFFDQFLSPIAKVEEELLESFQTKLDNPQEFTVDDVSLFLCKCDLVGLVTPFKDKNVDGELLLSLSSAGALSELNITDILLEKQLEFFVKLLAHRLLFNEKALESSLICRHRPVLKTILLLKEHDVALDSEIIKNKQISISQLIFFQVAEFRNIFGLVLKEAANIVNKLKVLRFQFETFLAEFSDHAAETHK